MPPMNRNRSSPCNKRNKRISMLQERPYTGIGIGIVIKVSITAKYCQLELKPGGESMEKYTTAESANMEGTAEDYERLSTTLILRYVESALDLHFPDMKWSDEDIILDIGCGTGRTTKNILLPKCPKFKKIVAIDIMPEYIEYARKKYFDKRIEYETRDILQRPNVKEVKRYDKIVSFYVFHRISDFKKLFSVISSILKRGGYFSFTFFIRNPLFSILREISNIDEWTKIIKRRHILDELPPFLKWKDVETEFSNFLSKFGLRVTSTNCEVFDVLYANKKAYLGKYGRNSRRL
ncbi:juvenile hormone acid O-methyltransferase-like [Centruroides sculpturatus]|uniref:juvenile hormone acid O-methyltransferase-like n=1 Tax=Centruroides sculpturatus TaxID=218467 RepID=UPI000C6E9CAF|nr:juvenile hormone acid O-methyltransferase-like [Centruroides sculpturatus]